MTEEHLLHPDQIPLLKGLSKKPNSLTLQRRARILLLYNEGQDTRQISQTVGISPRSVRFWRREFLNRGMEIFSATTETKQLEKQTVEQVPEDSPQIKTMPVSKKKTPSRIPASTGLRFPRVKKSPGIKVDDSMAEAGRKTLRFHFAHMLSHEKGTRLGEDIEELHDMRVATRRMRSAFEVFGPFFKSKVVKTHLKGLRATGRALGRMRDLDVFIEKARQYLMTIPEGERPDLEPLLNAWQQEQTMERDKLLAYLDSKNYQQFKQDFNNFVSRHSVDDLPDLDINPRPYQVKHIVPILIYTRLASVRAYDRMISNAVIEQLHALRIEFKKLRYVMEYFREVLGNQARDVINDLKILQDHLGDLNDADVACQILREFIETWEERQIGLPLHERQNSEPVVAYLATKHNERHNLMITFPEAWAHFNRPELLKNIALAISAL